MGNQAQKKTPNTFKWYPDDAGKIFPIDYSHEEFERLVGHDYRTIRKYLEKNKRLMDRLHELYSGAEESNHVPIPLEAAMFLAYYVQLTQTKKFHADFYMGDYRITEKEKAEFLHDLCRKLCQYIISSETTEQKEPERIFYKHRLLQNPTFAHMAVENLWEDEIKPRYEKMQNLIKGASGESLMGYISELLSILDWIIAGLSQPKAQEALEENEEKKKKIEAKTDEEARVAVSDDIIETLFRSLLTYRTSKRDSLHKVPFYEIDNTSFEYQTGKLEMRQAFDRLKSPKFQDNVHTQRARHSYMSSLVKRTEHDASKVKKESSGSDPQFEQVYEKCVAYLSAGRNIDAEHLEKIILKKCKDWWRGTLDYCCADIKYESVQNYKPKNYLEYQVDAIIYWTMVRVSQVNSILFDKAFEAANSCRVLEQYKLPERITMPKGNVLMESVVSPEDLEMREKTYKENAERLANASNELWTRIRDADELLFSDETFQLQVDITDLQREFIDAASFFDRDPPFCSDDELELAFQVYYDALNNHSSNGVTTHLLQKFNSFASKFLYGLITVMLKNYIEYSVPKIRDQVIDRLRYSAK